MRWPYRHAARTDDAADTNPNAELAWPFAIFWALCVARVVAGALRRETFGVDGALAFVTVALVPFVLARLRRR